MTDRRSFLAKLLCLPAAWKADAAGSSLPEMSPYKMFYDAQDYTGEVWYYTVKQFQFCPLIKLDRFPPGMGNDVRTPYAER